LSTWNSLRTKDKEATCYLDLAAHFLRSCNWTHLPCGEYCIDWNISNHHGSIRHTRICTVPSILCNRDTRPRQPVLLFPTKQASKQLPVVFQGRVNSSYKKISYNIHTISHGGICGHKSINIESCAGG